MNAAADIALQAAVRKLRMRGYQPNDWESAAAILRAHVHEALPRAGLRSREAIEQEMTKAGLNAARQILERGL